MGIADFLTRVLESAGHVVDLTSYQNGILQPVDNNTHKKRRRPMRIGLDASSWVYNATHGYGDMLADERHLSNYGRAALYTEQQQTQQNLETMNSEALLSFNPPEEKVEEYVQTCTKYILTRLELLRETTKADVLVVLDGASPPLKTKEVERRRILRKEQERLRDQPVNPNESPAKSNFRRTKAFKRAGAGRYHFRIIAELLKALRQAELSFLVAPYEADSELAFLLDVGYIDLVVTEDSDLIAHGAKAILYKSLSQMSSSNPRGRLLKFSDIGAAVGDGNFCLDDFTPVMMTILFVAVGCDYCDKLKGIGLVTASRIIRQAFRTPRQPSFRHRHLRNEHRPSRLSRILDELYLHCYMTSLLTPEFKKDYEEQFLSAIFMYRHPIVYDPLHEENVLISRCRHEQLPTGDDLVSVTTSDKRNHLRKDVVRYFADAELLEHEPYAELCRDLDRIQSIVGKLRPKDEAMRLAQGFDGRATNDDSEAKVREGGDSNQAETEGMEESGHDNVAKTQEKSLPHHKEASQGQGAGESVHEGALETQEKAILIRAKENATEMSAMPALKDHAKDLLSEGDDKNEEKEVLQTQPPVCPPRTKFTRRRLLDDFKE